MAKPDCHPQWSSKSPKKYLQRVALFKRQKPTIQKPQPHHKNTATSPRKTIQKLCGNLKNPLEKRALRRAPKKATPPPEISSN
jgi:hypothetical protein